MEHKTTNLDLVPHQLKIKMLFKSWLRSSSSQRVTAQWVVSWHLQSGPSVPSASAGLRRKTTLDPKQHESKGNFKLYVCGCFQNSGTPNGWFIMKNSIKMDDLGVPLFSETSMYITCTVRVCMYSALIHAHQI